jgi:hypothetical protein
MCPRFWFDTFSMMDPVARGACWGSKTEGIASHIETSMRGKTEGLGDFFHDHIPGANVPFFRMSNACVAATLYNCDWSGCGNSRARCVQETRDSTANELKVNARSHAVGLCSSCANERADI